MNITARSAGLAMLALGIEAGLFQLLRRGDLAANPAATIAILLWTSLFYLISVYLVLKVHSSRALRRLIFTVAIVFRLTVWNLFPTLSDDAYRYRWEGMMQAAGGNPYLSRPVDPEWAELRDATWNSLQGKDFKSVYGPVTHLLNHATYLLVRQITSDPLGQVFWFKLPAAAFDLGILWAIARLLRRKGLPVERALIYGWAPLPVLEFWVNGHNDSVAVFFVVLAFAYGSPMALSVAAAAKVWPLVLAPLMPRNWRLLAIPAVLAVTFLPFWSNVTENVRHLSGFLGGWRNNDSLFGLLLWLTGDIYRAKYLAFALLLTLVWYVAWKRPDGGALMVIAGMLFVAANCHPWYLVWMIPFLALHPAPGLLLWTALMPLSYQVVSSWRAFGIWEGSTPMRWWIYVPVFGMLAGSWAARRWRRWHSDS